ncbi:MAG: hypothetical protein KAT05_16055 [Spirochaetes bacterium]|nr:hypothetical protein [Spirochaetota bacterium]
MSDNIDKLEKKAKEIFDDLYNKMESRIKDLSEQVKDNIVPDTEEKLRKNIFKSVFFSFGIGFIFGVIITLFGISNGKKK